ncbi:hypothetical protein NQ318_012126 [Aromia moschata]|uniref:CR-type domain-containing protein n=1 Tax=Aromia moschata TaxID=1265417 RepID=A0AAV8YNH4_9CUCU|nr:hypothetical protein NQ318_012126 [Aromia moschata]
MATVRSLLGVLSTKQIHVYLNSQIIKTSSRYLHQCLQCKKPTLIRLNFLQRNDLQIYKIHTSSSLCARKNYYEVLGIGRNASGADILGDETKRKQYDTWGSTAEQMGGMGGGGGGHASGPQGFSQSWQYQSTIDPEELFRKIFGDAGFGKGSPFDDFAESNYGFGEAQEIVLRVSFSQAARGTNKDVNINVVDNCPKCRGSRCEPGTAATKCQFCNGTGMESITTGPFVMRSTCRYCQGTRMYIKHKCTECEGKGSTVQRRKVTIPVPAGIEDGQTVRMTVGNKEVFVTFRVEKSDYFKRDGADVHTEAEISIAQALLGGTIRIQGLYEDHTIQVMPGTSSHTKIRLSGKGMKKVSGYGHGDHYVTFKIAVPKRLDAKQKALALAYAELEKDTLDKLWGLRLRKMVTKKFTSSEKIELLDAVSREEKLEKVDKCDTDSAEEDYYKRRSKRQNDHLFYPIVLYIFCFVKKAAIKWKESTNVHVTYVLLQINLKQKS